MMVGLNPIFQWSCSGFLVSMSLVACTSLTPTPTSSTEPSDAVEVPENESEEITPTVPKKMYQLNEPIVIRDEITHVVVTFTDTRDSRGEDFLKPKDGHRWFYIKGTVDNRNSEDFLISPDFYTLTDAQKNTYEPSVRSHALKGLVVLEGAIRPQSSKIGEIGFEVPKDVKPVMLQFDIANKTACADTVLKPTFFCQPVLINLQKAAN